MKSRIWISALFWGLTLFLLIRYAHWILAGFAVLFLLGTAILLAAGLYFRHLWKRAQRKLEAVAHESFRQSSGYSPLNPEADTGPVIHIHAETVYPSEERKENK